MTNAGTEAAGASNTGRFDALSMRVERLEDGRDQLAAKVDRLAERIGSAPDASTEHEGSGLSKVVAELAQERRKSIATSAMGAGGGGALIALLIQVAHWLGWL